MSEPTKQFGLEALVLCLIFFKHCLYADRDASCSEASLDLTLSRSHAAFFWVSLHCLRLRERLWQLEAAKQQVSMKVLGGWVLGSRRGMEEHQNGSSFWVTPFGDRWMAWCHWNRVQETWSTLQLSHKLPVGFQASCSIYPTDEFSGVCCTVKAEIKAISHCCVTLREWDCK